MDQSQSEIIKNNPIGKGLDTFRESFDSMCRGRSISSTPDALGQLVEDGKKSDILGTVTVTVECLV